MINSTSEYEPGLLHTLSATRVKKLKILQRMYELISAFASFAVLKDNLNIGKHREQRKGKGKTISP